MSTLAAMGWSLPGATASSPSEGVPPDLEWSLAPGAPRGVQLLVVALAFLASKVCLHQGQATPLLHGWGGGGWGVCRVVGKERSSGLPELVAIAR